MYSTELKVSTLVIGMRKRRRGKRWERADTEKRERENKREHFFYWEKKCTAEREKGAKRWKSMFFFGGGGGRTEFLFLFLFFFEFILSLQQTNKQQTKTNKQNKTKRTTSISPFPHCTVLGAAVTVFKNPEFEVIGVMCSLLSMVTGAAASITGWLFALSFSLFGFLLVPLFSPPLCLTLCLLSPLMLSYFSSYSCLPSPSLRSLFCLALTTIHFTCAPSFFSLCHSTLF